MEVKYQIFEKDNLIIQKYEGIFDVEEYIAYSQHIAGLMSPLGINKVLIDFRDIQLGEIPATPPGQFMNNMERVVKFRRNFNEQSFKNRSATIIFWVDKPESTVVAHLFTENQSGNYHYCSSEEAIIGLLQLPDHLQGLNDIVEKLDKKY